MTDNKTLAKSASVPHYIGAFPVPGGDCEACKFRGVYKPEPSIGHGVWLLGGKLLTVALCARCTIVVSKTKRFKDFEKKNYKRKKIETSSERNCENE